MAAACMTSLIRPNSLRDPPAPPGYPSGRLVVGNGRGAILERACDALLIILALGCAAWAMLLGARSGSATPVRRTYGSPGGRGWRSRARSAAASSCCAAVHVGSVGCCCWCRSWWLSRSPSRGRSACAAAPRSQPSVRMTRLIASAVHARMSTGFLVSPRPARRPRAFRRPARPPTRRSHTREPTTGLRPAVAVAMRDEQRPSAVGSEPERHVDWNHRCASGVHGLDDLAAVDALEVDGRDAEVAVSELALDDDQRYTFAGHLDGVGVPELVRSETPARRRRARARAASARVRVLAQQVSPPRCQTSQVAWR